MEQQLNQKPESIRDALDEVLEHDLSKRSRLLDPAQPHASALSEDPSPPMMHDGELISVDPNVAAMLTGQPDPTADPPEPHLPPSEHIHHHHHLGVPTQHQHHLVSSHHHVSNSLLRHPPDPGAQIHHHHYHHHHHHIPEHITDQLPDQMSVERPHDQYHYPSQTVTSDLDSHSQSHTYNHHTHSHDLSSHDSAISQLVRAPYSVSSLPQHVSIVHPSQPPMQPPAPPAPASPEVTLSGPNENDGSDGQGHLQNHYQHQIQLQHHSLPTPHPHQIQTHHPHPHPHSVLHNPHQLQAHSTHQLQHQSPHQLQTQSSQQFPQNQVQQQMHSHIQHPSLQHSHLQYTYHVPAVVTPLTTETIVSMSTFPSNEVLKQQKGDRPKRAMSAYNMFVREKYRERREQQLADKNPDYAKQVGNMWAQLPKNERQKYLEAARQFDELGNNGKDKPKRAMSAYNMFVKEKYQQRREEEAKILRTDDRDFAKMVGILWSRLPTEERKRYQIAARGPSFSNLVRRPKNKRPATTRKQEKSESIDGAMIIGKEKHSFAPYNNFAKEKYQERREVHIESQVPPTFLGDAFTDFTKTVGKEWHEMGNSVSNDIDDSGVGKPVKKAMSAYNIFLKQKYQDRRIEEMHSLPGDPPRSSEHNPNHDRSSSNEPYPTLAILEDDTGDPKAEFGDYAKVWSELSPEEKAPYVSQAEADKKRFDRERIQTVSQQKKNARSSVKDSQQKKRADQQKVTLPKHLLPRPCKSAYVFYRMEQQRILFRDCPKTPFQECAAIIGKRWRNLSHDQREKYQQIAAKDRHRYLLEKNKALAEYTIHFNNANAYATLTTEYPSTVGMWASSIQPEVKMGELNSDTGSDSEFSLLDLPAAKRLKSDSRPTLPHSRMWSESEIRIYLDILRTHGRDYERIRRTLKGSKTLTQIRSWYGNYRVKRNLDKLLPSDNDPTNLL